VLQKKTPTQTFVHISANYVPIFKISVPLESSAINLQ